MANHHFYSKESSNCRIMVRYMYCFLCFCSENDFFSLRIGGVFDGSEKAWSHFVVGGDLNKKTAS